MVNGGVSTKAGIPSVSVTLEDLAELLKLRFKLNGGFISVSINNDAIFKNALNKC